MKEFDFEAVAVDTQMFPEEFKETPIAPVDLLHPEQKNYSNNLMSELKSLGIVIMKETKQGGFVNAIDDINLLAKFIAEKGLLFSNDSVPMAIYEDEHCIWKIDSKGAQKLVTKAIITPLLGHLKITATQEKDLVRQVTLLAGLNTPDSNPFSTNRQYVIPFKRTYNVHTNAFQDAQGEDFFTGRLIHDPLPYNINEKQDFEYWLEFLLGDSKRTFLEFLGLSFINSASLSQSALVSVGNTILGISDHGNGKSEIQLIVKRCFESIGKDLSAEVALSEMTGNDVEKHLKPLIGALVNFDDDADTSYIERSQQLKKLITGQAKVVGRDLYENGTVFQNKANFWLNTNKLPKLSANDGATERRIDLLVFQKNMRLKQNQDEALRIYDYRERLLGEDDTDLRKLIYLAIQTARNKWYDKSKKRYNQEQLYQSEYAKQLKGEWQQANSPIKQFLLENDYVISENENKFTDKTVLWENFTEWRKDATTAEKMNKATFYELLFKEMKLITLSNGKINDGSDRRQIGNTRAYRFFGIEQVTEPEREVSDDELTF